MPFIIFGLRTKLHDKGAAIAATCPRCHNSVVLHHVHVRRWLSLFFIPMIPLGVAKRLLTCPVCRWSRDVPKTAESLTVEMADITRQWQSGAISEDEYGTRVSAYWSFATPGGESGSAPASDVEAG